MSGILRIPGPWDEEIDDQILRIPGFNLNGTLATPVITEEVLNGDLKTFKTVIENGADPNIKYAGGYTPLMLASTKGYTDKVKLLLRHGANINAVADNGASSLLRSVGNGHAEIVEELCKYSAKVNATTGEVKVTPLLIAVDRKFLAIIKMLLKHGADPNQADAQGRTPLDIARIKGNPEIIKCLEDPRKCYTTQGGKRRRRKTRRRTAKRNRGFPYLE